MIVNWSGEGLCLIMSDYVWLCLILLCMFGTGVGVYVNLGGRSRGNKVRGKGVYESRQKGGEGGKCKGVRGRGKSKRYV